MSPHSVGMGLFEEIDLLRRERNAAISRTRFVFWLGTVWGVGLMGLVSWMAR